MKKENEKKKENKMLNLPPIIAFIIVMVIVIVTIIVFKCIGNYQHSYKNTNSSFDFDGGYDTYMYGNENEEKNIDQPIYDTVEQDTDYVEQDTSTDIDVIYNEINSTENPIESTETSTEEITNTITDTYYVDGINAILTGYNDEKYCSNMFSFDNPFKDIEVFRFTATEQNVDEHYIIGYVETPDDDVLCRFDYTLDEKFFMSITCTKLQ